MAEAEQIFDDDGEGSEEAEELEQLLNATKAEEEGEGAEPAPKEGPRFLFSRKFWFLTGGGTLLLALLAVGATLFLPSTGSGPEETQTVPEPTVVETVKPSFSKVHNYALQPFFLPLKVNNLETGNFISVIPHFILSNSAMNEEIEKTLPTIRRNIYNILIRSRWMAGSGRCLRDLHFK